MYIDPSLVQQAVSGRPLPFVADPIIDLTPAQRRLLARIWDIDDDIDDVGQVDIVVTVADALEVASMTRAERPHPLPLNSLQRVRDLLAAAPTDRRAVGELECVSGLDRWTLARQFRAAFGTSPSRFRTMRQLDQVRRLVKRGVSLADAALDAGFADQSHMSRMFKRAYGLTPARWAAATTGDAAVRGSTVRSAA